MSKAVDITVYQFAETDNLFFDANIWLTLYGPQGAPNDPRSQVYSNALAEAVRAKSQIWVDVLVVSEFVNRFARIEYDIRFPNKSRRPDFKQFRNSPDFHPISQAIAAAVRNILKFAARIESGFSVIDINNLLLEFEATPNDFNDQILAGLCKNNSLVLVTHDSDFKGKGVDILTANPRIIN
ncbi:MAG: PIN domain-containing protein [Chloroflexota bacterium]